MTGSENTHIVQNQRRKSRFALRSQRHFWAIVLGALTSAILVHLLGYFVLRVTGVGMTLSPVEGQLPPNSKEEILRPVVLQSDEEEREEIPDELPTADPDNLPVEDIQTPDPVDMELEDVSIAPGETSIGLESMDSTESQALASQMEQLADSVGSAGSPEPGMSEALAITSNPLKVVKSDGLPEIDPDVWNRENLTGNKGVSDANLPSGTKSLTDLLAQPSNSLGKKSGHGLIGADLLFEYDKAVMKNSARIGLLQLAALICKNPQTSFIIEGHTDSFGSREYNKLLSLMRANAVRLWLQANGIDMTHVYIRACGNERPVVPITGDRRAQAANRRVEIHMRKKGEDLPADALPISYKVDMETPIARQIAAMKQGTGALPVPSSDQGRPVAPVVPAKPVVPSVPPVTSPAAVRPATPTPAAGNVRQPSPVVVPAPGQGQGTATGSFVRQGARPPVVSGSNQEAPVVDDEEVDLEDLPARVVGKEDDIPVAQPVHDDIPAAIPVAEPVHGSGADPAGKPEKGGNSPQEPAFQEPLLP
ncbi:OmpA family protein [Akkermansia sp. N21169]|uniref:OmpA family protein n=1 Tax=Akkermansia sp. N21169 TaxID=3040765 RepID=UPI00244EB1AB|nr:OmpA family protein [Akkermansia sp. N21169]MDH3069628.1 OmpA family protein [Akkermansia sp. N21169]